MLIIHDFFPMCKPDFSVFYSRMQIMPPVPSLMIFPMD